MDERERILKEKIFNHDPRRRLIRYALNPEFLSDVLYRDFFQAAGEADDPATFLRNHPWLSMLCWVRIVFEQSDGQNYMDAFRKKFPENVRKVLTSYKLLSDIATTTMGAHGRVAFLQECWILRGGEDGETGATSEIWKFLTPLVRRLPVNCGQDEELFEYVNEYVDPRPEPPPSYFNHLIDNQDADFAASLQAMRSNDARSNRWLKRIAPLWQAHANRAAATANWMLYWNGGMLRLDLVVDDIYVPENAASMLTVSWGRQNAERSVQGVEWVHFPVDDLIAQGFDLSQSGKVKVGQTRVDDIVGFAAIVRPDQPLLFACPMRPTGWFSLIRRKEDDIPHRYTRRLLVAWPAEIEGENRRKLTFDGNDMSQRGIGSILLPGETRARKVVVLEFNDLADNKPRPLQWMGETLLDIGQKPHINVLTEMENVSSIDDPNAFVVEGDTAELMLRNLPEGREYEWSCDNANIEILDDKFHVRITDAPVGFPVRVKCSGCAITLIFIPEGALRGNADKWIWMAEENVEIRAAFAREGRESGILCFGDIELQLKKPLNELIWWWERGLSGEIECLNKARQFNSYGNVLGYHLFFYAPEPVCICLENQECKQFKSGPDHILVTQCLQDYYNFEKGVDTVEIDNVRLGDRTVASIYRVPDRPALTRNAEGKACIFIPEKDFDPSAYAIIHIMEKSLAAPTAALPMLRCTDFERSALVCLNQIGERDVYDDTNGAAWLVLIHSTNLEHLSPSLNDFSPYGGLHIEDTFKLRSPETGIPLRTRLGVNNDDKAANTARGFLDVLERTNLVDCGILAEAVRNREDLEYSNRKDFWNNYFIENCLPILQEPPRQGRRRPRQKESPPAPLKVTLNKMLRAGINWCAEPGWLIWAWDLIWDAMFRINDWNRETPSRRQRIKDAVRKACPIILSQRAIEQGYPICDQEKYPCYILGQEVLSPDTGVWMLSWPDSTIASYRDGLSWVGFRNRKILLEGNNPRNTIFAYHDNIEIKSTDGLNNFVVSVDNEETFLDYMLQYLNVEGDTLLNEGNRGRLSKSFNDALEKSEDVLGTLAQRGLGFAFHIASEGIADPERGFPVNRAIIFQTAVLCRLHAWLGYNGGEYPEGWPLSDDSTYSLVCRVASVAWHSDQYRIALEKDLVSVEWLLAWLHR